VQSKSDKNLIGNIFTFKNAMGFFGERSGEKKLFFGERHKIFWGKTFFGERQINQTTIPTD
jgi:hypothetical protein